MRRVSLHLSKKHKAVGLILLPSILIAGLLVLLAYNLCYSGRIFPNTFIAGVDVSGKSPTEATVILAQTIKVPEKITLTAQSQNSVISTKDITLSYDFADSANRAYNYSRTGNPIYDLARRLELTKSTINLGLTVNLDESKLAKFISVAAGQNAIDPVPPSVKLISGNVVVTKGLAGSTIDQQMLRIAIGQKLAFAQTDSITIVVNASDPALTDLGVVLLKSRAEKYLDKSITIKFDPQTAISSDFTITPTQLIQFINPQGGFNDEAITKIVTQTAAKVNRDPQNPKFVFANNKVTEFQPALNGLVLDNEKLRTEIADVLAQIETGNNTKIITINAPVIQTPPEVTTDKANNLGIKELIGRGTSTYFHSIPGRVYNVVLAASRINGILVKPGETFSFNDSLGDVSAFTGYQQAYIISGGKTILGDGGGVCQVSTTLFRALLNAGLPIVERAAHAYRVGYYEQNSPPGMDATVYGPSPDLKFTNDTGNYILIEAAADPKNYSLIFELYGTKDGRVATITKPVVSDVSPALPTVYQDDPTLPSGTIKQVDFSAAGAKVTFNYSVVKDGETTFKKTFVSNYRPWAAVYLRGTGHAN